MRARFRFSAVICAAGLMTTSISCSDSSSPTEPSPDPCPCYLLAGQSNAINLGEVLDNELASYNLNGSVGYWEGAADFAAFAQRSDLLALVWWQGAGDSETPRDLYVQRLRNVIAIARSANSALPVRIVEILDTPGRAVIREAQLIVAGDPGVELIPTADLPVDGSGHFTSVSLRTVRDRLNQSVGR